MVELKSGRAAETFTLDGAYVARQAREGLAELVAPIGWAFRLVEKATRPRSTRERKIEFAPQSDAAARDRD